MRMAHVGGQPSGRWVHTVRLETLRAHHVGSLSCTPTAGSSVQRNGCWTAPRSTTSATAPTLIEPEATLTPMPSEPRANRQGRPSQGNTSPQPLVNAIQASIGRLSMRPSDLGRPSKTPMCRSIP